MKNQNQEMLRSDNDEPTFGDVLEVLRRKWWYVLFSVVICCALGALYILVTPKTYTGKAVVLIKDPSFGQSATGVGLGDMGLNFGAANIENEVATFKSIDLLAQVVKSLELNNSYFTRKGLRQTELYHSSPVTLSAVRGVDAESTFSFKIDLEKNGDVRLYDFVRRAEGEPTEKFDDEINIRLGSEVKTPVGTFAVTRSAWPDSRKFNGKTISFLHTSVYNATTGLAKRIAVGEASKRGTIIGLSCKASSLQKADDILSEIITQYNQMWLEDKNQTSIATSNFINTRLAVIEKELGNVDSDISAYKSGILTPDVKTAASLMMGNANTLQNEIARLGTDIAVAEFLRSELRSDNISTPLPTNVGLNQGVEAEIAHYNSLVMERNRMLNSLGEKNPLTIERSEQLRAMKRNIDVSAANYLTTMRSKMRGLQSQENINNSRLSTTPNQAKHLLSVERQQKVQENLYLFLLQKREENEISQSLKVFNTQTIESPHGSKKPTSPRSMLIMFVAFIAGLAIPVLGIYSRLKLNRTIHNREDLKGMSTPFLGEIPLTTKKRKSFISKLYKKDKHDSGDIRPVIVSQGGMNVGDEAFRVLRSNLEFMAMKGSDSSSVIMFTSANPGSGKTFVATNLAAVLAIKGKKVLMVDLDLRKGTLSKLVGNPASGVSGVLAHGSDPEKAIIRNIDSINGLDMLPAGILPPNPSELLYSDNFQNLLDNLKAKYDYVLLDCPPVEMVADTQIISSHVDLTVFVMRAGLFDKRMLNIVDAYYTEKKLRNLCMILNGTDATGIYGYRSYGYGYGYGNKKR